MRYFVPDVAHIAIGDFPLTLYAVEMINIILVMPIMKILPISDQTPAWDAWY